MQLVDSVLAFALIMAALASVVTLMMEAFHRVLRLRAKGMDALFSQFYDDVLIKKLNISAEDKHVISSAVLVNPARKIIMGSSHPIFPNSLIDKILRSTDLSSDDLLKRLRKTSAFSKLRENTEVQIRQTLESIQDEYDEYSAAMSDYFKRRAKLFSLLLGVVLAFGANIDGIRIYEALKINPEIRASIISQQASFEQQYKLARKKLDAVASGASSAPESNREEIKALKKSLEEATSGISEIASLGLPIGWHYFPADMNERSGQKDATISQSFCALIERVSHNWLAHIAWVFKVLVTGLLIGLGAPFWFEIAVKLTRMKQGLKGKGATDAVQGEPVKPGESKSTIDKIVESI